MKCREPGCKTLQWAAAFHFVTNNLNLCGKRRNVLIRSGHDHDRFDLFVKNPDDARQQEFAPEGKPCLGPAHSRRTPAAKHDATGLHPHPRSWRFGFRLPFVQSLPRARITGGSDTNGVLEMFQRLRNFAFLGQHFSECLVRFHQIGPQQDGLA